MELSGELLHLMAAYKGRIHMHEKAAFLIAFFFQRKLKDKDFTCWTKAKVHERVGKFIISV